MENVSGQEESKVQRAVQSEVSSIFFPPFSVSKELNFQKKKRSNVNTICNNN
jgi:hypothetical protein